MMKKLFRKSKKNKNRQREVSSDPSPESEGQQQANDCKLKTTTSKLEATDCMQKSKTSKLEVDMADVEREIDMADVEREIMQPVRKKKMLVVAIDIGTTFSGWAFSFRHEYESNPTKVFCKTWCSGKNISSKAPTAVLIQPDGCTLEAFGYEAEDKYAELTEDKEHHAYYFFQRFKMMLHNKTTLSISEELEDDNGKRLPAKRVFSIVIKYLKDSWLEDVQKEVKNNLHEDEIQWVLTVPAIWNPLAKHFMRECAVEAGIRSANLLIALEPEAASLYCKYLTIQTQKENSGADNGATFQPGERYMVVDAGGGTIDIVVHEVCSDGRLKEIWKANGGHWGGTTVDKAFFEFLTSVFGPDVMKRFNDEHKDDFFELQREFEVKKRLILPEQKSEIRIKVPVSLTDMYKTENNVAIIDKIEKDANLNDNFHFKADKIVLSKSLTKGFFDTTIKHLIAHLKDILQQKAVQGTSVIFLVGGFAESPMLFDAMRDALKEQHVLVPGDAGLSVLKGAVIFGHDMSDIRVRISQLTYGFETYDTYNPLTHPRERMQLSPDGIPEVRGCFQKLVEIGEELCVGAVSKEEGAIPRDGCYSFSLNLFASTDKNPVFVDDPSSFAIGELIVDCRTDEGLVSPAIVRLMFGETEFEVQAILEATGAVTNATFSFMD